MGKTLRENQRAAATGIVEYFLGTRQPAILPNGSVYKYPAQRTVILYGGTGCGKTAISVRGLIELGKKRVIVIVPPCGGVVFNQWLEEFEDAGRADCACLYHGAKRAETLAQWRANCDADGADGETPGVHFVVTSIATLHADAMALLRAKYPDRDSKPAPNADGGAKRRAKKYTDEEVRWAFAQAATALGKFDLMVLDEFQEFRNGSPPTDEKKAVDTSKPHYMMLDAIASHSTPLVLGLSATPVVNSSGELFSFLRLGTAGRGVHDQSAKLALLERTRHSNDKEVKGKFKKESNRIRAHMIIPVEAPVVPPTTHLTIEQDYTLAERTVLSSAYGELQTTASTFLQALISHLEAPENPMRRAKKEMWKNKFLSLLTHAKRLTIAPMSFQIPRQRADDPFQDPQLDSMGNVVMTTDERGDRVPLGRLLPFDVIAAHAAVPVASICKFNKLIEHLSGIKDRRVMILCEFSDPLDLFALYLRDAFPSRAVYKFHGGVSGRDRQLAAFKNGPDDAILLATRGACGMAVNVECTTTVDGRRFAVEQYQLDLPMAQSLQDQAEGRIKRPLAQGHPSDPDRVESWVVTKVKSVMHAPTLEDWLETVMSVKNARCADMLTDRDEQRLEGKETEDDTVEGIQGPLLKLIELLGGYAPTTEERKRKKAAEQQRKRERALLGGSGSSGKRIKV